MKTEKAEFYTDGAPHIFPVKPVLRPENTRIVDNRSEGRVIFQEHPYAEAEAAVYSPEELAGMGFEGLTGSYSLVTCEGGEARIAEERRGIERVTREAAKVIELGLDADRLDTQNLMELAEAERRLKAYLEKVGAALVNAYIRNYKLHFAISAELDSGLVEAVREAVSGVLGSGKGRFLKAVSTEQVGKFLEEARRGQRSSEMAYFETMGGDFAWEELVVESFKSLGEIEPFLCSQDMVQELLDEETTNDLVLGEDVDDRWVVLKPVRIGTNKLGVEIRNRLTGELLEELVARKRGDEIWYGSRFAMAAEAWRRGELARERERAAAAFRRCGLEREVAVAAEGSSEERSFFQAVDQDSENEAASRVDVDTEGAEAAAGAVTDLGVPAVAGYLPIPKSF